jgi:hypothetical protein
METRSTILSELKELSPAVANIGTGLPYQVPQGYFEGLASAILMRIKTESLSAKDELETISPLLSGLSKKHPFEVPQGYFSELSENVVGGVKAIDFIKSELQGLSPLMESLRHRNVYQVPEGYFESLAGNILGNIKKRQPAKVVSMGRRVMRYAAAAVVTGVIAIGAWMYFGGNGTTTGTETAQILEKIGTDKKISDEDISNYLETETSSIAVNTIQVADEDMDETDLKELLTEASEDELQQYLTTL